METAAEEHDRQDAEAQAEDAGEVGRMIRGLSRRQLSRLLDIVDEVDALDAEVQRQAGENGRRDKLLKGGL